MSIVPPTGFMNASNTVLSRVKSISFVIFFASLTQPLTSLPVTDLIELSPKYPFILDTFSPDFIVRVLPATISTFFPSIFTFPLGALIVIPVNASISTSPMEEAMYTLRFSVDIVKLKNPYASPMVMPPLSLRPAVLA